MEDKKICEYLQRYIADFENAAKAATTVLAKNRSTEEKVSEVLRLFAWAQANAMTQIERIMNTFEEERNKQ